MVGCFKMNLSKEQYKLADSFTLFNVFHCAAFNPVWHGIGKQEKWSSLGATFIRLNEMGRVRSFSENSNYGRESLLEV